MNGAESLVRTLVAGGVDVCFANPGTSEMHFVAALDRVEGMRCVLGLFEGVVTGAADGAAAIAAAKSSPPQIATLILPADTAWNEADGIAQVPSPSQRPGYSQAAVDTAAKILHGGGSQNLLLITGSALTEKGLALAQQIAGKTGCKVMGQTYHPRMARGRGRFSIDRIPYVIELALPILKDFKNIVLVETNEPIAFFAYPNKPSILKPEGCEVHRMTAWGENAVAALEAL